MSEEEIRAFKASFNADLWPIGHLRMQLAILLGRRYCIPHIPAHNHDYMALCKRTEGYYDPRIANMFLEPDRLKALAVSLRLEGF